MDGQRLKICRDKQGLSQKDLAERIGLTDKQVWRYENGLRKRHEKLLLMQLSLL